MSKMSTELIGAAKAAASLTIRLNGLDFFEDTTGEDSLATLVISLANHIEALEDDVEYEYAIMRSSLVVPGLDFVVGDFWGDKDERDGQLKKLTERPNTAIKYWLIKRRKAGKVENA